MGLATIPHAMRKEANFRRLRLAIGIGLSAIMFACGAKESTIKPVRAELIRLQKQTGLSLAYFDETLDTVLFEDRSVAPGKNIFLPGKPTGSAISPDGDEVAISYSTPQRGATFGIMRQDGSGLREFPAVGVGYGICWSYNKSMLAIVALNPERVVIKSLESGKQQEVNVATYVTSQCWSPDDKRMVYEFQDSVRLYDIERNKWRAIAKGRQPTWSPDGNWISFLDGDTYYAIRPSGEERKELFKREGAVSGLFWSPDSRIVAYVSRTRFPERPWLVIDIEFVRLRVRRLEDHSEDWVLGNFSELAMPSFQWVKFGQLDK